MAKKICISCGKQCGFWDGSKIKDKSVVCFDCKEKVKKYSDINKILIAYIYKMDKAQFLELYNDKTKTILDIVSTPEMVQEVNDKMKTAVRCVNCNKICNGIFDKWDLADGSHVCAECRDTIKNRNLVNTELSDHMSKMTSEEFKTLYQNPNLTMKDFVHKGCKICGVIFDDTMGIIDFSLTKDIAALFNGEKDVPTPTSYSNIVKYEYKEGETTVTTGGSGIGRAVVGGLLFNGAGAVVGAVTKKHGYKNLISDMSVYITFKINNEVYVKRIKVNGILDNEIKYGSSEYVQYINEVEKLMLKLDEVTSLDTAQGNKKTVIESNNFSDIDELRKYKKLLDEGILTNEEFEKVKKKILDI